MLRPNPLSSARAQSPTRPLGVRTRGVAGVKSASVDGVSGVSTVHGGLLPPKLPFADFSQRPRLLGEMTDTHAVFSSLTMASSLIKDVAKGVSSIKGYLASETITPEIANNIDIEKRRVRDTVNTKVFERYVLDSAFNPSSGLVDYIRFTIPALTLSRHELDDEVVTLYLANKLFSLRFDRTERVEEKKARFVYLFGLENMELTFKPDGQFVIGVPDDVWRSWDGLIAILGEGKRFAKGQPLQMQVVPETPTVEDILGLSVNDDNRLKVLQKTEERLANRFAFVQSLVAENGAKVDLLSEKFSKLDREEIHALVEKFKNDPSEVIYEISIGFRNASPYLLRGLL